VGQSIKAWSALIAAHPADALSRRALFRIGAGYQQIASYERASDNYEAFREAVPG
jgi:hypothetical protein